MFTWRKSRELSIMECWRIEWMVSNKIVSTQWRNRAGTACASICEQDVLLCNSFLLNCDELYCIILYHIVFCFIKTVLYCVILYGIVMYCIASSRMFLDYVGLSRIDRFARPKYFFHVTQRFVLDNSTVKCCIVFYLECCAYILCRAVLYGLCWDVRWCTLWYERYAMQCLWQWQWWWMSWSSTAQNESMNYPHAHVCERYSFSNNWTAAAAATVRFPSDSIYFFSSLHFTSLLHYAVSSIFFSSADILELRLLAALSHPKMMTPSMPPR